jgi:hypothetical protein
MVFVFVADGVGRAFDAANEVAIEGVAVRESRACGTACGRASNSSDSGESAVSRIISVGDVLFDGWSSAYGFQYVAFVALQIILFVIDDASELGLAGNVVGDGFFVEGEGGRIVVVIGAGETIGLDNGAAEAVMGDVDSGGDAVVVGDLGEAPGDIGVSLFEAGGCGTGEKAGGLRRE